MDLATRNNLAVLDEMKRLRAEYNQRLTHLENQVKTHQQLIQQLQSLFATRTVARDTGATTE